MKSIALGIACLGLWGGLAAPAAGGATNLPSAVVSTVVTSAVDGDASAGGSVPTPAETNAPSAVSSTNEPPAAAPAPVERAGAKPIVRASEMGNAFAGAGSSKFGVHGRVNNIPGKTGDTASEAGWRRSLELGVSTSQGNSETLRYEGFISGSKETEEYAFFLKAGGRYGESDEQKDAENATGEAKAQRRLTERVYAAAEANVFYDRIADLDYRARGSLSLGRHFIWTERTVLNAEIGPGYVAEKKGGTADGFMAGRAAQYLEHLVTPNLQIWETVEYVPNLEDFSVYFVNTVLGLETALISNLSLRFTVEDRYDSSPAEGKESNDLTTTTALVWGF